VPKIGKIRFVNFTYNENRHIYDQTFDFYNGEDTLLNLQNGGGKTVLVQMMMQPIIPKQKLKDRLFKSYFMNTKAPVYIMIEWILDDRPQRVLTGIGIKRILGKNLEDEGNSIRIVTFLSEYEEGSDYDIKNIRLTNEEKGIVKLIDFDRVVKSLSEAQKERQDVWLFRWNIADDKKEYTRRLAEYKINPVEWKNLMVRINEAEAGLNSFFNDCKTNKALIKKWFIPTIEDQLNKNGNLIENIKELIKNHAGQLVKNEDMLAEREIFEDFKRKSAVLITSLEEYRDLLVKAENNQSELGNAYIFAREGNKKLGAEKEETVRRMEQTEDRIRELEYQKLSSEYYTIEDSLQKLNDNVFQLSQETGRLKTDAEQLTFRKNLLLCIKLNEELKNLNSRIAKFESELEKESRQEEDINNQINDIRYSLKEKYKERILQMEKVFDNEKLVLADEKSKLAKYYDEYEEADKEILSLRDRLITISGHIGAFDESETSLRSVYPDFQPVKSVDTGEYGEDSLNMLKISLDTEEAEIEQSIQKIRGKRLENADRLLFLEQKCRESRNLYPGLAIEKKERETSYQSFQKDRQEIERIIRSYQLKESWLFDKEKLLLPLQSEKEKYQKLINDLNLENSVQGRHLKQYEAGKTFEISDEIKQRLEEHHIFAEFGHDWLRNRPDNKKEKLKIVRNNPFLPYALIVSEKDLELIKDMEFKGILSPVIPVIEREKLEQAITFKAENYIYAMEGIHFLLPFDDRVLNKNYLKEICGELSSKIGKNNAVIENAQEAMEHITAAILKIENFAYTSRDAERLPEEVNSVTAKCQECIRQMDAAEEEIVSLKQTDTADQLQQSKLENQKDKYLRKKSDLLGFIQKCAQYSRNLKEKRGIEDSLNQVSGRLTAKEHDITELKRNINDRKQQISNIAAALETENLQYQKYADAKPGRWIEGEIENLESRLQVYTSEISGKLQNLQDILEDYRQQKEDKQKTIESYDIPEQLYLGRVYHAFEYEEICESLEHKIRDLDALTDANNEIQFKLAERRSDLKYKSENIEAYCGYPEPLQREYIKDLDFEKEKLQQKAILKELEKKTSQIKKRENLLQRVWFTLEEYRDLADKVTEPVNIEGDLGEYVLQLIKDHKKYISLVNDNKNAVSAHYITIESEFVPKAEVFKNLFHSILNGERRYQPAHALNAFQRVFLQIDRKLEQFSIDVKKIDDMEKYIIANTLSYLKNVYDEMAHIDRNSTIDLDGRRCKMLIISLPELDALESISLKEYLKSTIMNCVELYKQGKSMEGLLDNEINTYNLFDRYVSVNKVEVTLIKIEPNKLKKKSWRQVVSENSGGELFVSAFVVFISLLTYMRGDHMPNTGMDGKVLIMDNPFGPITSEHLLKPLFEISKKYNTQMICLTDVKGHTIYDRFNLIYSLNIEREVGREDEYIELKTVKKDIRTEEDEILSASMFKIEDKSRFELAE